MSEIVVTEAGGMMKQLVHIMRICTIGMGLSWIEATKVVVVSEASTSKFAP